MKVLMLQKSLWMKSNNDIKKEFLESFFKKIQDLTYGVIDVDDNLNNLISNDIDVWVKKNNLIQLTELLYQHSKSNNWIIKRMNISPRVNGKLEAKYALLLPVSPFPVIQIDLWVDIHWRSFPIMNSDLTKFIQKSTYFKKVDNEKSLFIQIIKDLLYKNNLTNKVKDRIKKNNLSINNLNFFLDKYYNLKCQNKISEIIKLKTENSANSGEFKRSLIFNTIKNRPLIQIRYFFNYCFRFINSKILSQDGMHVILLGPDGAGKSTIGELVYDSALVNDFYEEKIYGHTNFKIIPPLQLFLKPFKNNYTKKEYIPRDIKKLSTIKAMIYPLYYLIDYMLGFLWLYKKKTNGGAFVIFDRYFDEYYIQKTFHNLSNKYLNILQFFVPKPTLYFLISDNANSIYERKQELPLGEIKEQLIKYTKLIESKDNGFIIKNDGTPVSAANQILSVISANINNT